MILVGSQSIYHVPIVLPLQNYNTTTYCQNLVINQETIKQLMLIHTWRLVIEMSIQRSSKVQGL